MNKNQIAIAVLIVVGMSSSFYLWSYRYDEGFGIGYADGSEYGFRTGYSDGSNDGYYEGRSDGFEIGNETGWEEGYHRGLDDGAGHGWTLRDPSYSEMRSFILRDRTDRLKYVDFEFICVNFGHVDNKRQRSWVSVLLCRDQILGCWICNRGLQHNW